MFLSLIKINCFDYQGILCDNFVPRWTYGSGFALIEDKASKSVSTLDWLSANIIKTLDSPPKNPDINKSYRKHFSNFEPSFSQQKKTVWFDC